MKVVIYKLVLLLWACLLVSQAMAAEAQDPAQMLKQAADRMVSYLETNKEKLATDEKQAKQLVRKELLPYIDQMGLGRRVLSRRVWDNATQEQRTLFVEKLISLVIDTYAKGLAKYDGERFIFSKAQYTRDKKTARIKSTMEQKNDKPVQINYTLKKPEGLDEWRVIDVSIEGVSMVLTYRSQFRHQIKQDGFEKVLEKLVNQDIELKEK